MKETSETRFTSRRYPESNKEKLPLISRYVERDAYTSGSGKLRASFQRTSRIKDEKGTRRTYQKVDSAGVDVHIYGVPD